MSLDEFVRTQSNLLRNFQWFNFGDRDKDVWSEGNTVGGEELNSRPGGEKFEHADRVGRIFHPRRERCILLFAKAVSRGNACEVRRSTYRAERRVHGETERETKPRKISHGTRESRWNSERKLRRRSLAARDPEALNIRSDPTRVIKKAEFATLHRLHLRDRVKGQSSDNSASTI
ncbi:hypothetical protein B0H14DRAFT_3132737 [Mycena olivaceomarginata]|nr:hypothetical protein B0H14DRAFT_3132737 [Mycena olivaceomarginata]